MRIGVISDTHGVLNPRVVDLFLGVDHILHAGDIGSEDILAELRALAPVTAVAGNIDGFRCGDAGETARVRLGGRDFFLTHIFDRPRSPLAKVSDELRRQAADVVLFGHSHLPHDERIGATWFFNPASAGPRRFDYPCAVGFFEKKAGQWRSWHAGLDARSEAVLAAGKHRNQLSR
ncbi:MAG: metallophosphoesterase family protein [Myxococcales bacterium]